jgi:hypothetical protein
MKHIRPSYLALAVLAGTLTVGSANAGGPMASPSAPPPPPVSSVRSAPPNMSGVSSGINAAVGRGVNATGSKAIKIAPLNQAQRGKWVKNRDNSKANVEALGGWMRIMGAQPSQYMGGPDW